MQAQWEATQAGLRVFLEEDGDYLHFLENVETNLTRTLRFQCQSRSGALLESVIFDRFVETIAQLRHFHTIFQVKLKPVAEPPTRGDVSSVEGKCSDFVEIMADMLTSVRVLYGQLFCRSEATQAILEAVLSEEEKSWDGLVLENYLQKQQLTVENLVSRPLRRFEELVEFVEALSKTLSESDGDGVTGDASDAETEEKLNYAPQLMHIVQESKHYIHLVKTDAREEEELIALQTSFVGNGADAFHDLSTNKLLLHGEVFLAVNSRSESSDGKAKISADSGSFSQPEEVYLHCFQDGTLVCSTPQESESGRSFTISRCLQLKQDAAYLEFIPISVPMLASTKETHALALILRDTALVFTWLDSTESQRWADVFGGFLEMNGSRTEILHQDRTIGDLPVPEEIKSQLADNDTIPTEFISFYDDHLPGVFWMAPGEESSRNGGEWDLVEIVFYARWLFVYKLNGWKHHSLVCHFDTHAPEMEISEQPRGEKEWSLVISNGSAGNLTLVSKKRTRIDFWFDQVCKFLRVSARRAEREKRERQEMEEEEGHVRSNNKRGGKKRKLKATSENGDSPTMLEENVNFSSSSSPAGSGGSKPGDKTDEEGGEQDRSTTSISVEEELSAAPPAMKKTRPSLKTKLAPVEDDTLADIATPAVNTPKSRWLKRKSEDPNDTTLVPTQPSPSIPTDESTSEIDISQLPANAEAEPKTQEVRIILTGVEPTAAIRKKIESIAGAVYEEDVEKATHILAPKNQLKRTVKLLCGISRCAHVLDVRWLEESARVGVPVYERAHCLKDAKAEAKWHFDLLKTMYDFTLEQRQQLFAGHQVFITSHKSVLPPVKDLVKIVECAGGTASCKGKAGASDLVISSEAALATAGVRKTLTQANPTQIYSAELILSGILQQHIDFDKNRLEQSSGGRRRR